MSENSANKNTKSAERIRLFAAHSCSDILFEESNIIQLPQAKLLANYNQESIDRDIIETALSQSALFDRIM